MRRSLVRTGLNPERCDSISLPNPQPAADHQIPLMLQVLPAVSEAEGRSRKRRTFPSWRWCSERMADIRPRRPPHPRNAVWGPHRQHPDFDGAARVAAVTLRTADSPGSEPVDGFYELKLDRTRTRRAAATDNPGPSLYTAVQEQLRPEAGAEQKARGNHRRGQCGKGSCGQLAACRSCPGRLREASIRSACCPPPPTTAALAGLERHTVPRCVRISPTLAGWVDLRHKTWFCESRAPIYPQDGAPKRGLAGYLGNRGRAFSSAAEGGAPTGDVPPLPQRPPYYARAATGTGSRRRASPLLLQCCDVRRHARLRSPGREIKAGAGRFSRNALARRSRCRLRRPGSTHCTVFPAATSVSMEMDIIVTARREPFWWSIVTTVSRPVHTTPGYGRRLDPVDDLTIPTPSASHCGGDHFSPGINSQPDNCLRLKPLQRVPVSTINRALRTRSA